MQKESGENDNVVQIRSVRDSYNTSDGGAILTDRLDPVLFVAYFKQKETLDKVIEENRKWVVQYEASQKLMKQWRLFAGIGFCLAFWFWILFKIVSEHAVK